MALYYCSPATGAILDRGTTVTNNCRELTVIYTSAAAFTLYTVTCTVNDTDGFIEEVTTTTDVKAGKFCMLMIDSMHEMSNIEALMVFYFKLSVYT